MAELRPSDKCDLYGCSKPHFRLATYVMDGIEYHFCSGNHRFQFIERKNGGEENLNGHKFDVA